MWTREIAQQSRALAALARDPILVPSMHIRQLTQSFVTPASGAQCPLVASGATELMGTCPHSNTIRKKIFCKSNTRTIYKKIKINPYMNIRAIYLKN